MFKRLFLFMAISVISTSAMCMEPFMSPSTPELEWKYMAIGWVQVQCPNCYEIRLFPSEEFVLNRRLKLTAKEEQAMIQAISTYDGDIVPGRMCPFCGRNLPTAKDFE
jgi:hypothetical protein